MEGDAGRPVREKLGERVLNLMDDMANWGQRKYVPGEVDVFTIDHTHELYGHMNINYLQLDRLPRFDEGWQSVLDVLRDGKFFVTTGEILIPEFTVGGKPSGDVLKLPPTRSVSEGPNTQARRCELSPAASSPSYARRSNGRSHWPLPKSSPATARSLSRAHRSRPTPPPSAAACSLSARSLHGRRWVRLEIWDIATNGAFTQPVWLE